LSAGQKRRLAIARLLLFPKQLWIVDEPLTALDHDTQRFFLTCLETHSQQGGMAIITSHQELNLNNITVSSLRLGR
jgi:heme exporter protein A